MNYLNKTFQKQEECSKQGHLGEEVMMISSYGFKTTASCYCKECDNHYNRRATQDELNNFNKVINEPFTI